MYVELEQMNAKVVYYDIFGNVLQVLNLSKELHFVKSDHFKNNIENFYSKECLCAYNLFFFWCRTPDLAYNMHCPYQLS
jgi:S-adenosylmethionine hydrolase